MSNLTFGRKGAEGGNGGKEMDGSGRPDRQQLRCDMSEACRRECAGGQDYSSTRRRLILNRPIGVTLCSPSLSNRKLSPSFSS